MARSAVSRFMVLGQRRIVVVGVIAVALTAGCGSSGPSQSGLSTSTKPATSSASSAPAVAGVDACSLVSASEASAVVKETLSRAATSTPARCDYVGQDTNTTVQVTVRATTPAEFASRCANDTAFSGLGDAACGAPKAFLLRKGTTEVDFTATTILGAGQVTMNFSTLAKTVLTRL